MLLQLRRGSSVLGSIAHSYFSDRTWYGTFHEGAVSNEPSLFEDREVILDATSHQRLRDFIAFSRDWHVRLAGDGNLDASEFDQFEDVVKSRFWQIIFPGGRRLELDGAPVFFDNEITWRTLIHPKGWGSVSELRFD